MKTLPVIVLLMEIHWLINIDKGHTDWFLHKIINAFIQDYHNQTLHKLYLDDYEISSICINLALEIVKDKHDKKLLTIEKNYI